MRDEFVRRIRCFAEAMPRKASAETTLATARVMINCVTVNPFCFRLILVITPPNGQRLWDFRQEFGNAHAALISVIFVVIFRDEEGVVLPKVSNNGSQFPTGFHG